MVNFADVLGGLDTAVRDVLCDDAVYIPASGAPVPGMRIKLEEASESMVLQGANVVLGKSFIEVERAAVPKLKRNEAFDVLGVRWKLAEAPRRPDDGRWWRAAVEKVGRE